MIAKDFISRTWNGKTEEKYQLKNSSAKEIVRKGKN
jgi:hypothetical protein